MLCYMDNCSFILFFCFFSPRMEAPYFIFKCISVGVNNVLLLLLLLLLLTDMSENLTKAMFTPQLWDRNGSGTQPGARVHTCSTSSGRSGTSRPPRDVIAVERFRNGSGWLCGVNARLDPFRNRSSCP